ncbi:MAG: radical SAM protein [Candidatus Rokubacteria bacterium]|nr:radical SAM protein [Candidatus Rokubacteria bacterium]
MTYKAYAVSWNLTRRCNLFCAHCYMSAAPGADAAGELSTDECRRVMADVARVNPNVFLILTGGEPLIRKDLFDLAACGRDHGFTVVLGTNGVLLREKQARLMRQHGIQGASLSLDSTDPAMHDRFRHLPGAWQGAVRATEALRAEGLDFSIHMSVTDWNVGEIPAMIDLARELGARVLNFFFLVRTGRGERLTDIAPVQYEEILTYLARIQGVGAAGAASAPGSLSVVEDVEDPWSVPAGRAGDLLIRAKCAPHFRRILYQLDPRSPLLANYAHGACPAGKYYCRITPEGDVTPCPYMPVSAGNVRQTSFAELWARGRIFSDLRESRLGGRCGACEFRGICGGCRCRAYATFGDYLAEDPACAYQPGSYGGEVIRLPAEQTFGLEVRLTLSWEPAAQARLDAIPAFARGMVVQAVEACARSQGLGTVTPVLLAEVRSRWGITPGRPFTPRPATPAPRTG